MQRLKRTLFTTLTIALLSTNAPAWAQGDDLEGQGFIQSTAAFRVVPLLGVIGIGLLLDTIMESNHTHSHAET